MNLNLINVEPENLAAFILTNEFVLKRERERRLIADWMENRSNLDETEQLLSNEFSLNEALEQEV